MGQYSFKNNSLEKKLEIVVEGVFSQQNGMDYVTDYNKEIRKINPKEYDLLLDCTKLAVTPADVVPQLQGCFELYKANGFKKVSTIINASNGAIIKMQFNRLARIVKLDNLEIIEK